MSSDDRPGPDRPNVHASDVLRFVLEIVAIVSLAIWGFRYPPVPLNIALGIVVPAVAITLWALFRAPRAVVRTPRFWKAVVEIAVMGGAALAWWSLGHPIVAVVFAVVAAVDGVICWRHELS